MVLIKLGCGGVDLSFLHYKMQFVLRVVESIWDEEPVITSTIEGNHIPYSWHYLGRALDFRIPREQLDRKVELCKKRLGIAYDVVVSKNSNGNPLCVHIEYEEDRDEQNI